MTAATPRVSVVIPAYNAEDLMRTCLESVLASEGVTFEVIVVNDASTDATARVAQDFGCRVISLRANILSANCRNLGAELARGEIVVFFDADQTMAPDTLKKYAAVLDREPEVTAVVGSLAARTPLPGFFSQFKNFQHHYTHQTADPEGTTLASGLMAVRRDAFLALGGFEPAFAGASIEDIALGYHMVRNGHRIRFAPAIQVVHWKGYTLRQLIHSDIVHRAVPWTGLMLRERVYRNDLNTKGGNVASVGVAALAVLGTLAGIVGLQPGWFVALGAVALIVLLNRHFLAAIQREFGLSFAVRSAVFLPLMYTYYGVGLLAGIGAYASGKSVASGRRAPEPDYELIEPEPSP